MSSMAVRSGLSFPDYAVVALYALGMIWIGWYFSRRQKNLDEYFVAGRGINWLIVGISLFATLISTISYLTTPGEIIKNGPGILWSALSPFLAFGIIGWLIIPRIMGKNIMSGYELLDRQFGRGVRSAAAVMFILMRISWIGLIVYTCSIALNSMTGWPLPYLLVGMGLVTTLYTVMGGVRAVIITDVVQAVILFGGAALVVSFAMFEARSLTGWFPDFGNSAITSALNWRPVKLFPDAGPGFLAERITIITIVVHYVFYYVCICCSDQLLIQRFLTTRDARAARNSFLTNTLAGLALSILLALTGFALLAVFTRNIGLLPPLAELKPEAGAEILAGVPKGDALAAQVYTLTNAGDKIFPWFIAHLLPAGLSGLLLAALFSAAMSSISSGINSISTVLMVDFKGVFGRNLDEAGQVARARLLGVGVGIVAICVSFVYTFIKGNFMDLAQKSDRFLVAPMAGVFLMAFFMRRTNWQGAWVQIVVTCVTAFLITFHEEIFGNYISFVWIFPFSLAIGLAAGYVVSLLFPAPDGETA